MGGAGRPGRAAVLKQRGVWRSSQAQGSCLSLTVCLRFLWSGFPWETGGKGKAKSVSWVPTVKRVGLIGGSGWALAGRRARLSSPPRLRRRRALLSPPLLPPGIRLPLASEGS